VDSCTAALARTTWRPDGAANAMFLDAAVDLRSKACTPPDEAQSEISYSEALRKPIPALPRGG
jgi:hypothetical protein